MSVAQVRQQQLELCMSILNLPSLLQAVVSPASRALHSYVHVFQRRCSLTQEVKYIGGTVKIANSNPFSDPIIDPNFLSVSY